MLNTYTSFPPSPHLTQALLVKNILAGWLVGTSLSRHLETLFLVLIPHADLCPEKPEGRSIRETEMQPSRQESGKWSEEGQRDGRGCSGAALPRCGLRPRNVSSNIIWLAEFGK